MKRIILGGILAAGVLAGFGCEASFRPAPIIVGGEVDVGPYGGYYDRGGYVGDFWVWHDDQGREMREARTVHESRMARSHAQGRPQAEHRDEHQEGHEERR